MNDEWLKYDAKSKQAGTPLSEAQKRVVSFAVAKGWLTIPTAEAAVRRVSDPDQHYPSWVPEDEMQRAIWHVRQEARALGTYTPEGHP